MRELSEDLLADMVARLVATLEPEQIYLFGSQVYGTPNRHSDLDFLVVVADHAGDTEELALAGRRALLDYPFPVDILVYPRSEMDKWAPVRCSLPHTVVGKGRVVYAARSGIGPALARTGPG